MDAVVVTCADSAFFYSNSTTRTWAARVKARYPKLAELLQISGSVALSQNLPQHLTSRATLRLPSMILAQQNDQLR